MNEKIYKAALLIALGDWPFGNQKTGTVKPPVDLTPEEMSEAIMIAAALACPACGD